MKLDKVLYTAHATSTGGREGTSRTDDGMLDVKLTTPKQLGGNGAPGTNPEQLFAAGYSACFIGAMKHVAVTQKIALPADTSIKADVGIGPIPQRLRHPGRAERHLPGMDTRRGREAGAGGAPGLPVLERDARQHRRHADRRLTVARRASAVVRRSSGAASARCAPAPASAPSADGSASPRAAGTMRPSRQRVLRSTATPPACARSSAASSSRVHACRCRWRRRRCRARRRAAARRRRAPLAPPLARDDLDPRPARRVRGRADRRPSALARRPVAQAAQRALLDPRRAARRRRTRRRRAGTGGPCAPSIAAMHRAGDTATRRRARRRARRRRSHRAGSAARRPAATMAGRIAPVSTTGLAGASTRCRKYAVSSSVSVPCVTTMPATSARASWCGDALREARQIAKSMSLLSICATCSASSAHAARAPAARRAARRRRPAPRCSRRCRRRSPPCRRSCRRCRARRSVGARRGFAFSANWMKIQDWMDHSAMPAQGVAMQRDAEAHRPPAADPRSGAERDRAHRRAADARRDRQRARLPLGQRGRGAPAGAGAQGRHRAGRRHVARHPPAV